MTTRTLRILPCLAALTVACTLADAMRSSRPPAYAVRPAGAAGGAAANDPLFEGEPGRTRRRLSS